MLEENLIELIQKIQQDKCENQTLELKKAKTDCPKVYDTLSSFSNQDSGGIIVFGIDEKDNFNIVGVYDTCDIIHKLSGQCKQMEPEVRGVITSCLIDGKSIVALEVPSCLYSKRPVYYKGAGITKGSYVRVGEADEPMNDYEIYSYEAFKSNIREDIRISNDSDMIYIDEDKLQSFVMLLKNNKTNTKNIEQKELLSLLGLIKDGKPTLSTIMCFSKYPQALYPQLCITLVLVPGNNIGDTEKDGKRFVNNKKIEGTIPEMIEQAMSFIMMNMKSSVKILNGVREDIYEYPPTAIREAVINALVHRDYSVYSEGIPIRIEMFKNRIEITNPGGLYGFTSIDKIGGIYSDTRNKTLISVLETMNVVENRFSGIPTIIKELKKRNLPSPVFKSEKGYFKIVIYNGEIQQDYMGEHNLVEFCKKPRTRKEIAEFLDMTQYYAMKKEVEPLIMKGIISYTIPSKPKSKDQKFIANTKE